MLEHTVAAGSPRWRAQRYGRDSARHARAGDRRRYPTLARHPVDPGLKFQGGMQASTALALAFLRWRIHPSVGSPVILRFRARIDAACLLLAPRLDQIQR